MTPAAPVPLHSKHAAHAAREQIFAHFEAFPDPAKAVGAHFAKRSHPECNGRGLVTMVNPAKPKEGVLVLCDCARRRLDREAEAMVKAQRRFQGPPVLSSVPPAPKPALVSDREAGFDSGAVDPGAFLPDA